MAISAVRVAHLSCFPSSTKCLSWNTTSYQRLVTRMQASGFELMFERKVSETLFRGFRRLTATVTHLVLFP